jgi:hypothetical protein
LVGSGSPLSATWIQSSSAVAPFFFASLITSWAVLPAGSFSTTNSWSISNDSLLVNPTTIGVFAGTLTACRGR